MKFISTTRSSSNKISFVSSRHGAVRNGMRLLYEWNSIIFLINHAGLPRCRRLRHGIRNRNMLRISLVVVLWLYMMAALGMKRSEAAQTPPISFIDQRRSIRFILSSRTLSWRHEIAARIFRHEIKPSSSHEEKQIYRQPFDFDQMDCSQSLRASCCHHIGGKSIWITDSAPWPWHYEMVRSSFWRAISSSIMPPPADVINPSSRFTAVWPTGISPRQIISLMMREYLPA